jgi:Lhr-like helicase
MGRYRAPGLVTEKDPDAARRCLLADPPDLPLTTPESVEAKLVSTRVDPHQHFARLWAIVVDEVHAFAGADAAGGTPPPDRP